MTPKEQAKLIYDKFYNVEFIRDLSKTNAELCVDEILKVVDEWDRQIETEFNEMGDNTKFWELVKYEIGLL